jgi:hypothetical protein
VPILEDALKDPDFIVRFYTIQLLLQRNPMELTNPPGFAAVTNLIYCSPQSTRYNAVQCLGSYGKSVPEQAIRNLTSLSQDTDEIMRATATNALRVLRSLLQAEIEREVNAPLPSGTALEQE